MTPTKHYSVHIKSGDRSIVKCDDFVVPNNEISFLFGESGIGKSLICKAIYGLLDPDELSIDINGAPYCSHLNAQSTKAVQRNSFFVFQEPSSHLNPLLKISEQLSEGSLSGLQVLDDSLRTLWENSNDEAIKKILALYPKPYRPSGGEKQRMLLAMAFKKIGTFLQSPSGDQATLFAFDEPTGSLDNNYRDLFLDLLFEKFYKRPFTVLFITHDYSIISRIYSRHKDLVPKVHFKELSRKTDTLVELSDFSAQEYLTWLNASRPPEYKQSSRHDEVLNVDAEFSIFRYDYRICKDPQRTRPVPLTIRRGEMVYIKAASGVGKTTLAKIIMGLYHAHRFSMKLGGIAITHQTPNAVWAKQIWGKKAGMVFQLADEALDLASTIQETFEGLPLAQKLHSIDIKNTLLQLFDRETITDGFFHRKVAYLSGGQKQRLNLLRTLALNTDLLILDEPLNGLDFLGVKRVLNLLEEKRRAGGALLLISHNEEIFDSLIDQDHMYYLA
ncbi:MAG: ATP-binding cassette domain-containing protein [Chitinivibrionales bacterium]